MKIGTLLVFSTFFIISCSKDPVNGSNGRLRSAVQPSTIGGQGMATDPRCIPVDGFIPPECPEPPKIANPPATVAAPAAPKLEKSCRLHNANFYDQAANPLLTISSGANQIVTKSYAGVDLRNASTLSGVSLPAGVPPKAPLTIKFCDDINRDGVCTLGELKNHTADPNILAAARRDAAAVINTTADQLSNTTVDIMYSQIASRAGEEGCDNILSDPLMFDLAGSGLELSDPYLSGALFDIYATGIPLFVSWPTKPTTGFLVNDINRNGQIDDGSELFGDSTRLKNGGMSPDGFTALADLVTKGDGTLDSRDQAWSKLGFWPGFGNVKTLAEVGITKISLKPRELQTYDEFGNYTSDVAKVTIVNANGNRQDRNIYEVWLKALTPKFH